MEDKEILSLFIERNELAIRESSKKYGGYCKKIAMNILHNAEDAEESINDTYMKAWNSIPPHQPEILSAFLGKLTRNICLKKLRDSHAQKRGGGELPLVYEELSDCIKDSADIQSQTEEKELTKIINDFLLKIPETERNVFICRYWYFDGIKAISEQFGYSESKIKSMLFRTRKKLHKVLEEQNLI